MALAWGVIFSVAIDQIFGQYFYIEAAALTIESTRLLPNKLVLYISQLVLDASSDGLSLDPFLILLLRFTLVVIQEFANQNIVSQVLSQPSFSPSLAASFSALPLSHNLGSHLS